ncbi:MAG: hypothetical protein KAW47_09270, partial [Thermoplasmatales archaeon]|nr:hypothetical protein [Thermoplasmatales archaeon]
EGNKERRKQMNDPTHNDKTVKKFKNMVIEEYMKILNIDKVSSYYYINPYIPISKLRKKVCKQLNISNKDFDKEFLTIKRETSEHLIHLTQPMLRGSGGVKINNKYYHFIGIFSKKEKRSGSTP